MRNEHAGYRDLEACEAAAVWGLQIEHLRLRAANYQHGEDMGVGENAKAHIREQQIEAFESRFVERHAEYLRTAKRFKGLELLIERIERHRDGLSGATAGQALSVTIQTGGGTRGRAMEIELSAVQVEGLLRFEFDKATAAMLKARFDLLQLGREEPPRDGGA